MNRFFIMGVISIFIYNLFLFTDREMLLDIYLTAWKIRLAIVTPVMLICLFIMRRRVFDRFIDFFADFLVIMTSASIKECVHRPQDLCARYGGEEFIVLLPNTSQKSTL
jgi:glucan phosphoethanolaminetransferase (alkaline phosphatase superfamily)